VFTVRFGSVFIKKSNQTEFFFLKKPKPVQTDRFWFGFLEKKPVQTGLARFFQFGSVLARFDSVLARLARFFPIWLGFFGLARFFPVFFRFGSVQFFRFQA
jgi:hypothetical protein